MHSDLFAIYKYIFARTANISFYDSKFYFHLDKNVSSLRPKTRSPVVPRDICLRPSKREQKTVYPLSARYSTGDSFILECATPLLLRRSANLKITGARTSRKS